MMMLLTLFVLASPVAGGVEVTPSETLVDESVVFQVPPEMYGPEQLYQAVCSDPDEPELGSESEPDVDADGRSGLEVESRVEQGAEADTEVIVCAVPAQTRVELIVWAEGVDARRLPLDESGRIETSLSRPGRYSWRLVAVVGRDDHVLAEAMTGPIVRDRSIDFDLLADSLITLPANEIEAMVSARVSGRFLSQISWKVDDGPWTDGKATWLGGLSGGTHVIRARVFGSDLTGGERMVSVVVQPSGAMKVAVQVEPGECDPTLTRECSVRLTSDIEGGNPPYDVAWQPALGQPERLDGDSITFRYSGGRHIARARVTDSTGLQATGDGIVHLKDVRATAAAVVPVDSETELPERLLALDDDLRRTLGASLRFQATPAESAVVDASELCTLRGLGPDLLAAWSRGRSVPWDFLICPRIEAHSAGHTVVLRFVGVIGNPDLETTIDCGPDVETCAETVRAVAGQTLSGLDVPDYLIDQPAETPVPTGELDIQTEAAGADVRVNGAPVGRTPLRLEVPVGRVYEVEVRRGDRVQRMRTELEEPIRVPLKFRFEGARTWLEVTSEPSGAAVYVEGEFAGLTPLRRHRIPEGTWTLRLIHSDRETVEHDVAVSADSGPVHIVLPTLSSTLTIVNQGAPVSIVLDGVGGVSLAHGQSRTWGGLRRGEHRVCVDNGHEEECERVVLPRDEPLVVALTAPPPTERVTTDDAPSRSVRVGVNIGLGYRLVSERSHFAPPGTAFGAGLGLEGLVIGPVAAGLRLDYTFSDGASETRVAGRDLPVSVAQHAMELWSGIELPFGCELGAKIQASHLTETLNPTEGRHRRSRELFGLALGPEVGVNLLSSLSSEYGLRVGYSIMFVIAPRETQDEIGRAHALSGRATYYF